MTRHSRTPKPVSPLGVLPERAFTLVELTLVIIIIVLLIVVAVPAFSALNYSSGRSGSVNAVRAALESARDAAVRAGRGNDAAAVFLGGADGRLRAVVAVRAGSLLDDAGGTDVLRDVFVPAPGSEVVLLPQGWSVRGYGRASAMQTASLGPSGSTTSADNAQWYEDTYEQDRGLGQWLFPETALFDDSRGDNGEARQSFMVRFEGGTGRYLVAATGKALLVDPAPTLAFRDGAMAAAPWNDPALRVDRAEDLGRFVRRVLADPALSLADRRDLLGDRASDTVLLGPVGQLAVYNERRMANAIGADGVNRQTLTLYQPIEGTVRTPTYDAALFGGLDQRNINTRISQWIRATDDLTGAAVASETSDVRMLVVSRYLGIPVEVERLVAEGS